MSKFRPLFRILVLSLVFSRFECCLNTKPSTPWMGGNKGRAGHKFSTSGIMDDLFAKLQDTISSFKDKFNNAFLDKVADFAQNQLAGFTTGLDTMNVTSQVNDLFVLPGTKWCGYADSAGSYEDFGKMAELDNCCKHHDLCPDHIKARSSKYNLTNNGLFTRSHCDCEDAFYKCLKNCKEDETIATLVGKTYFNLLRPQCFKNEDSAVVCEQKAENGACIKYQFDKEKGKMYQWFDPRPF